MKRRMFVMSSLAPIALAACGGDDDVAPTPTPAPTGVRGAALDALTRAAKHMDENVSFRGGYVWQYLPDLSVSWGEMEAKRSMCLSLIHI